MAYIDLFTCPNFKENERIFPSDKLESDCFDIIKEWLLIKMQFYKNIKNSLVKRM